LWPSGSEMAQYGLISNSEVTLTSWSSIILHGIQTALLAVLQLSLIVIPLMIVMQYLRDLGWLKVISNKFAPFTRFLGMKENTSFTLVAGFTIGFVFGVGVIIRADLVDAVAKIDMMLVLFFLVTCHSVFVDRVLFIDLFITMWLFLVIIFTRRVTFTR